MADGKVTLKFDVEPNEASVQQSANEIQSSLDRALRRVGGFNSITNGMRNAFSTGFSYAQSAATKTFTTMRQQMYNVLSSRWADPTFSNVASQFTSGMKRGVEQLGVLMGDKLRQMFDKADVDAKPLAEEIGTTVEQTLKSKIAKALVADGKVLGGFSGGQFVMDDKAYSQRWGDLMLGEGGENEFAEAVSHISAELAMAAEESARLEENGEQASEQYRIVAEMAETAVNSLRKLYGLQGNQDFGLGGGNQASSGENITSNVNGVLEVQHNKLRSLGDGWDWLKGKIADVSSTISTKVGDTFSRLGKTEFFQMVGRDVQRIGANFNVMAQGVHNVGSAFQKLGSIAGGVLSKVGGAITRGIGNIAQFGKQAGKSFDKAGNKAKRMTLQMIKAMLGVRGLYMLFRKMKSAVTEAFQAMAQQIPEIGDQFNSFKTALNQIKGSIGTAFQPIISAVLPILTQLLGMLNSVIEAVARFNAVLMGQNKIYKYTAAQQEFAKSVGGTGKAAKKATADLMGFDEINRLSAPNEGGGGGGAGGMGTYEAVDVDPSDAISEFAEKLKTAWKTADFTEIGQIIGTKLKEGMETATSFFDTEGQKWAQHLSSSLTTLINGLVSVPDLGESIGTALGSGINVGITFLRDFWRDTDFTGIGEQLAGAINGLFDKVDWTGLGEYFGYKFNGIFSFIDGLATNTDWINIGTSLGEALNTMVSTMDVGKATSSVSSLIVGLLQGAISFITTTDWEDIGGKLADGLAGIDFSNILSNAGTLISKGAQGILDMVIGFIKKTDWSKTTKDLTSGIEKMFDNVWDDGELIKKLSEGFGGLIGAALAMCFNVGGWIYDSMVKPLIDYFSGEMSEVDADLPDELPFGVKVGTAIIGGLFKGILDALIGIGEWIANNVVMPIYDGICDAFGIEQGGGAQKMLEVGESLINGFLEGIAQVWVEVQSFFEQGWEDIKSVFEGVGTWFSDRWEDIKGAFTDVGGWFSSTFQTAYDNVTGIFESVGGWFGDRWDDIKQVFGGIGGWFSEKFGFAWSCVKSVFSSVGEFFQGIFDDIKGIFTTIGEEIGGAVSTAFQSAVNWILEKAVGLINGFISALNAAIDVINYIPGVSISNIDPLPVPQLAQGAVLPPNQPFLAMVGDQKSGTNVEAPLDTIKQAVAEVMNEQLEGMMAGFEAVVEAINNKDTTAVISYRAVGEANRKYTNEMETMRGY